MTHGSSALDSNVFIPPQLVANQSFPRVSNVYILSWGEIVAYGLEQCGFGPGFKSSSTFKRLPNETLRVSYGSGETLTGIVGTEKVTFGGISVDNQQVGIIDHGSWQGHGIASGLVGLAFPSLTNTISGNESEADTGSAVKLKYNPIFTSMYTEGLVDPVFSLAIDRGDSSGGILTLGRLPTTVISSQFISVPLEMMTLHDANSTELISMQNSMDSKPAYQFYAIHIDGFVYGHIRPAPLIVTSIQVIVDSGNTLNRIPANTSMAINEQFDPPARYNKFRGAYMVQCDATAPQFGVTIAGQTFYINKVDMIYKAGPNDCLSAITDAPNGMSILGDAFLKNVVAVFDVGASEMRFAAREY